MAGPCCGVGCHHWQPPRERPATVSPEIAAQFHLDRGNCRRFPEVISKLADEVCGEHPELVRQRDDELASRISWAIEAAQRKPPSAAVAGKGRR